MGKIICVGLGPGQKDLMSVKSDRLIRSASKVAFFRKKGTFGQARSIVEGMLMPGVKEYPMEYPITSEYNFMGEKYKKALREFYDNWARKLETLSKDTNVIVLCEGDPFFYGSFMHLHTRILDKKKIQVIPGISGMSGCWTALEGPFAWGDDSTVILMGTAKKDKLMEALQHADATVIMKVGSHVKKIKECLGKFGMLEKAWLVENGTMKDQKIIKFSDYQDKAAPYFSIILVQGQGRRP